jgi:uncharacterized membrane protein
LFAGAVKKYFITGLLIWIPLVITIWVLKLVVDVLDQSLLLLPAAWQTERWLGVHIPGLGAILTVVIVFVTGVFATNFFGAQLVELWHEILHRIPVVNSIYSSVKQISDTLFSSSGQAFRKALLVQWPHEGMWTIGFLTGTPGGEVLNHVPPECVAVYVPTTPNPTGGYFVIVARKDVIELDMSVDQALKYIISMGVVPPQK